MAVRGRATPPGRRGGRGRAGPGGGTAPGLRGRRARGRARVRAGAAPGGGGGARKAAAAADFPALVGEVLRLSDSLAGLSDRELVDFADGLRQRARNGESPEDSKALVAAAFAATREAGWRAVGLRAYACQVEGALALNRGMVAEMATGEGKTLVATMPAALNALAGEPVHVVTANDYLAQRDSQWMGRVFRQLGLQAACVHGACEQAERRTAYAADVTYVPAFELGWDYLRDHSTCHDPLDLTLLAGARGVRPFGFAIVDEVDSVLVDESRTPLQLTSVEPGGPDDAARASRHRVAHLAAEQLRPRAHFKVDAKLRQVELLPGGSEAAEAALAAVLGPGTAEGPAPRMWAGPQPWGGLVLAALRAQWCYERDRDYIVRADKVVLVDEATGRLREKSRLMEDMHSALEAKERVEVRFDPPPDASVTLQTLFNRYRRLAGMTGTAAPAAVELWDTYGAPVHRVAPHRPCVRVDEPAQLFVHARDKWEQVAREVLAAHARGQPVLVGTGSVEDSEFLSRVLAPACPEHRVLNARPENAARESTIVAQAGRRGAVTLATNMAGRGTDILLGGSPEALAREFMEVALWRAHDRRPRGGAAAAAAEEGGAEGEGEGEEEGPVQVADPEAYLGPGAYGRLARMQAVCAVVCPGPGPPAWALLKATTEAALGLAARPATHPPSALEGAAQRPAGCPEELWASARAAAVEVLADCRAVCAADGAEVRALGGLLVVGTEVHENRRVDLQLRGRAGRQGDPGRTKVVVSAEDKIMTTFGVDFLVRHLPEAGTEGAVASGGFVDRTVKGLQRNVDNFYAAVRQNFWEYDQVLDVQRQEVYALRMEVLGCDAARLRRGFVVPFMFQAGLRVVAAAVDVRRPPDAWDAEALAAGVAAAAQGSEALAGLLPAGAVRALLRDLAAGREPALPDAWSFDYAVDVNDELEDTYGRAYEAPASVLGARAWSQDPRLRAAVGGEGAALPAGRWRDAAVLLAQLFGGCLFQAFHFEVGRELEGMAPLAGGGDGDDLAAFIERRSILRCLDVSWKDHQAAVEGIRTRTSINVFQEDNPIDLFKVELCANFDEMIAGVAFDAAMFMFLELRALREEEAARVMGVGVVEEEGGIEVESM